MSIDRTQKRLTTKPGYSAYTMLVGLWMFALAGFAQGPHGEWHRRQGEAENSYRQGDYSHSVRLASEALGIARHNAAFEEIALATQLLAKNLIAQGHYLKAKIHLQEAIAAWANTDTPNAILLSTAHNSLAGIEHRLWNDETARTEYSRAIDILEAAQGETHPKLSSILNGLGNLQLRNGELTAAKASFSRALSIREESLNPRDPALAACLINLGKATYHNLGVLLADQGLLSSAEPLFRKAIKASERTGNISNLQRYKSHLAALLRATGRSEEADRLIPEKPPTEQDSSDQPVLD